MCWPFCLEELAGCLTPSYMQMTSHSSVVLFELGCIPGFRSQHVRDVGNITQRVIKPHFPNLFTNVVGPSAKRWQIHYLTKQSDPSVFSRRPRRYPVVQEGRETSPAAAAF